MDWIELIGVNEWVDRMERVGWTVDRVCVDCV